MFDRFVVVSAKVLVEPTEAKAHDEATLVTGNLPADLSPTLQRVQAKLAALEAKWTN